MIAVSAPLDVLMVNTYLIRNACHALVNAVHVLMVQAATHARMATS